MNREVFAKEMRRLEALFGANFSKERAEIYYERLLQYEEDAFCLAVHELIGSCERFPTLARTIQACDNAQRDINKKKHEEERALSWHDLERTSEHPAERGAGREYLSLIKDILNKKLPADVWEARLKELQEKYGQGNR